MGKKIENLSIVIIVKNEVDMLPACLNSVNFAGEVLVVDTGSTDNTVKIAKKSGAKVITYLNGKNFSDFRNKGLKEAGKEWLLYIDADERVTPELKNEIEKIVDSNEISIGCGAIPRKNIVLGKHLKHGGWSPDYVKRLYYKKNLEKWTGDLHEEPEFIGEIHHLKNLLIHEKHESFSQMIEKTNNWSEIEAKLMFNAKHPKMNIPRFATASFREFWNRMIKGKAFLDGKIGIMFALYQVFSRFISYAKLWELQEKNESSNI